MDGHQAAQERVSNNALSWLRALALAIEGDGSLNMAFSASELAELCDRDALEIPGSPKAEGEATKQIGRTFSRVFKESDTIEVDGFVIRRSVTQESRAGGGPMDVKTYTFAKL